MGKKSQRRQKPREKLSDGQGIRKKKKKKKKKRAAHAIDQTNFRTPNGGGGGKKRSLFFERGGRKKTGKLGLVKWGSNGKKTPGKEKKKNGEGGLPGRTVFTVANERGSKKSQK